MLQNLVKHCKNKNELEALALSTDNPNAIFFTADTNSIILGGKIFGIGNSLLFMGSQSEYDAAVLAGQIPYGTIVIIEDSYLTFTALGDNCSIGFYNNPDATISPTIEYSFDKNNWSVLTNNVSIEKGCEMYCRGINPDGINSGYDNMYELGGYYNYFTGEGQFNVSGDIMSLINYEIPPKTMVGTFCNLFGGNGASPRDNFVDIVDASKLVLSAKTLTNGCYANMFFGCTSLITAPEVLPATTLTSDCYMYMFAYCSSLTTTPLLPATTLADSCYNYMFAYCFSLTTTPLLPATTLADSCYNGMFNSCDSLTTTPELPATTLANKCYSSMFSNCTALTTAPALRATTLAKECYSYMFNGCTKLNYIKCLATDISADWCTSNWVTDVSSTGMFFKHQDMTNWTTGINGIPSGWAVKDPYTPQECVTLEITADNVSARKTNTTIYYTATTNGIYDNGDRVEGRIITGKVTSDEFGQNTSYTDTVERTITFEFMGVTATTTITQDVWKDRLCDVVLNDQWRLSETQSNPDLTMYEGVYESFSNKGIHHGTATMYIDLIGYTEFDVYIRSYAESGYDYITISEPNSNTEKATTKDNQNSGQDISSYTRVHYDNLTGNDRITITYIKDGSGEGGNDQGYILIPKQ